MPNVYVSREALKQAAHISGADLDSQVDRIIEAVSAELERQTHRLFYPKTQTRTYRWPPRGPGPTSHLWLDQDLIAVTSLKTKAQDASPTTIASTDYFLEPANEAPPYDRIEIDSSSAAAFESGSTPQRSIEVVGRWGYREDTKTGGTVASGLASDAAATSMVCSNGSLIDVGNMLLIQSESIYVSNRSFAALGSVLVDDAAIAADVADVSITLDASHGVLKGETMRLDSEEMYVEAVSGTVVTVKRAWNGTVLATHANDTAVHINRTLTIVRAQNGTTGAVHADATAVSVYTPPADIVSLALAEAIAVWHQEGSGWGRVTGTGEGAVELSGRELAAKRKHVLNTMRRVRMEAV